MSTLRIISLIVAAIALIASLILGMMIMNGKKTLAEKFDATLDERFGEGTSVPVKGKPALDKLTHFNARAQDVQTKLAETEDTLRKTEADFNQASQERDQARASEQQAKASEQQATQKLGDATQQLQAAQGDLENSRTQLNNVRGAMRELQTRSSEQERQLRELGDAPARLKAMEADNAKLKAEHDTAIAQAAKLEKEIENLKKVSPDLVGSVVKSDPAWSFIVVDLGKEHSIGIEGSNFFVYRGNQYKGEVKVTRADRRVSIADVVLLPSGARSASIASGDKVLAARAMRTRVTTPVTPAPAAVTPAPAPRTETRPAPAPKAAPVKPTPAAKAAPAKTEKQPEPEQIEREQNFGPGRKSPYAE